MIWLSMIFLGVFMVGFGLYSLCHPIRYQSHSFHGTGYPAPVANAIEQLFSALHDKWLAAEPKE